MALVLAGHFSHHVSWLLKFRRSLVVVLNPHTHIFGIIAQTHTGRHFILHQYICHKIWNIFAIYPIFSVDICKYPPVLGQCGSHMTNMEAGFCLSTVWQFRWPGCAECAFYKPIDGPGDLVRPVCHYCWAVVRLTGFPCLLAYVRSGLFRRAA